MYTVTHACRNNGLDKLYAGRFLCVVVFCTFKPRDGFDCDSCKALFGTSYGLCSLFVGHWSAVGCAFCFMMLFRAGVFVPAKARLLLVDRVLCRVCGCGAHRLFAFWQGY